MKTKKQHKRSDKSKITLTKIENSTKKIATRAISEKSHQ